jgi:hypothetical protein
MCGAPCVGGVGGRGGIGGKGNDDAGAAPEAPRKMLDAEQMVACAHCGCMCRRARARQWRILLFG